MKEREQQIPPAAKPRLAEAIRRLIDLYTAWDERAKAKKWRKELEAMKPAKTGDCSPRPC